MCNKVLWNTATIFEGQGTELSCLWWRFITEFAGPSSNRMFSGWILVLHCYLFLVLTDLVPLSWPNCQKIKVKLCLYRPIGLQKVEAPRNFRQSAHEGGKVVSPYTPAAFTPQEISLAFISVRVWVDTRAMVRPEILRQWKTPITPSGIEPATFRLVSQRLNQVRHRVPLIRQKQSSLLLQLIQHFHFL